MPDKKRSQLELEQDLTLERRSWLAERVGWGAMALVLIAGLLGLFGPGMLNMASAGDSSAPLWLEYGRFWRLLSSTALQVHLNPGALRASKAQNNSDNSSQVRVWLSRDYVDRAHIESVVPAPESVESGSDRVIYTFKVTDRTQPAMVTFNVKPEKAGLLTGRIGLEQDRFVEFTQWIHP